MNINNPVTINLESTSKYNPNIQAFRGIAIIAVIIIHTIPKGEWQIYCRPFVNYAVALFLFYPVTLHLKKRIGIIYVKREYYEF